MGLLHRKGIAGLSRSPEKAQEWLKKAVQAGDEKAKAFLSEAQPQTAETKVSPLRKLLQRLFPKRH